MVFGRLGTLNPQVDGIVVGGCEDPLFRLSSAGQHRDHADHIRRALLRRVIRDFKARAVAVKLAEDPAACGADATGLLVGVRVVAARFEAGERFDGGGNAVRRDLTNDFLNGGVRRGGLCRQSGHGPQQRHRHQADIPRPLQPQPSGQTIPVPHWLSHDLEV